MEERERLAQLCGIGDPAGVEHERLEHLLLVGSLGVEYLRVDTRLGRCAAHIVVEGCVDLGFDVGQDLGCGAGEAGTRRRAEQHRGGWVPHHGLAALIALQLDRRGKADLLGDDLPDRGVHQLLIAVAHAASMIAVTPRPPAAQIEISPRLEPFCC